MNEVKKLRDRSNAEKWAHPELADVYTANSSMDDVIGGLIYNQDTPKAERKVQTEQVLAALAAATEDPDNPFELPSETLHVPGCPEEPETEAELLIFRPTSTKKRKLPVVYGIPGGGMFTCMLDAAAYWRYADIFNAVVVCPRYRTVFTAPYPAALNDMHAGYKYVVDHAEELGINPDKIVITGASSGSNQAISLAFRLKRYGYKPRGVVTECGFTDFRPIFPTSPILQGGSWNSKLQFLAGLEYIGGNNVAWADDPEMMPNLATVEDCIGLCPVFMHGDAEEANSASNADFMGKLSQAGVYNEFHNWGGCNHSAIFNTVLGSDPDELEGYPARYFNVVKGNIQDCFKYDLRRTWIAEELGL